MQAYQHILIALDVFIDYSAVLDRALAIAGETTTAKLSLAYITEPTVYSDAYLGGSQFDVRNEMREIAKSKLKEIGVRHMIPPERQIIESGRTAQLLHEIASQQAVDLIVIGSHGRHGAQLLLGSTANAVLHGATCDVLAVRVGTLKT